MADKVSEKESRRVSAACRSCRSSKLKCSGTQPCDRCRKRSADCIYDTRDGRDSLDDRIPPTPKRARLDHEASSQNHAWAAPTEIVAGSSAHPPLSASHATAELGTSPHFLRNKPHKRKRWLYLGASSTWAFNIRVATMIRSALEDNPQDISDGFTLDGDAYNLSLTRVGSDTVLDLSRLPSLDYAIYLVNTVRFHLGGMLRLFDEDDFIRHLHDFYSDGPEKAGANRLWYTQCLLLLALGKGFLNIQTSPDNTSSVDFFLRALAILPDTIVLHNEPVLAAEVLATIALFFYCLDMKHSAYAYIGQALRLVLVEGLHSDLPVAQIGEKFSERCRNVWWTVYILDRTLSFAVGAPVSVQDDHIRQPLGSPTNASRRDATLIMHVKLCRVTSYVLTELYTANGSLEHSYLSKVRSVLRRMADIAKELEDTIDFRFKSSLETLSKGALYLRMLYNQCIILAIRPLLICLLQDILSSFSDNTTRRRVDMSTSIRDLLQTCEESATKTLKMLVALSNHNLLESFLPFDLEFACSASSVLIMLGGVLRTIVVTPSATSLISRVLNEMTSGGNKAAPLRQRELEEVSALTSRLWKAIEARERRNVLSNHGLEHTVNQHPGEDRMLTPELENPNHHSGSADLAAPVLDVPLLGGDQSQLLALTESADMSTAMPTTTSSAEFAQTFDFPQAQMLFLADNIDVEALPPMLDFGPHVWDEWL